MIARQAEALVLAWAQELGEERPSLAAMADLAGRIERAATGQPTAAAPMAHHLPAPPPKSKAVEGAGRGPCGQPGCERGAIAKGLCKLHWERQRLGRPMDAPVQRGRRKAAGPAHDNPTKAAAVPEAELGRLRKLDCSAYRRCLLMTARKKWAGFTCSSCAGPAPKAEA